MSGNLEAHDDALVARILREIAEAWDGCMSGPLTFGGLLRARIAALGVGEREGVWLTREEATILASDLGTAKTCASIAQRTLLARCLEKSHEQQ